MTISKRSEKSLQTLIKELDEVFSIWVRKKYADSNGYLNCFITGVRLHWKQADAAHYIRREKMATRWHEWNVHPSSIDSNRFDPEHERMYGEKMIEVFGIEQVTELHNLSHSLAKWTRPELEEKIEYFRSENRLKTK